MLHYDLIKNLTANCCFEVEYDITHTRRFLSNFLSPSRSFNVDVDEQFREHKKCRGKIATKITNQKMWERKTNTESKKKKTNTMPMRRALYCIL